MIHFSITNRHRLAVVIACTVFFALTNCKEDAVINNEQELNQYTFYPDGGLKTMIVDSIGKRDTFYLTKDGQLEDLGKFVNIYSTKDSVSLDKLVPVYFGVAMFPRVLLRFQARILDSSQHVVWDTMVERTAHHSFEAFHFEKKLSIPGEYQYKILGEYVDSVTKKVIHADSAVKSMVVFEKRNTD